MPCAYEVYDGKPDVDVLYSLWAQPEASLSSSGWLYGEQGGQAQLVAPWLRGEGLHVLQVADFPVVRQEAQHLKCIQM